MSAATKTAPSGLQQHPLSAAFPAMLPEDFDALRTSVAEVGVLNAITTHDGMVIDGWHRYSVAQALGRDCPMEELGAGVDPRIFVLAQNKARRHITQAQIAMATAEVFEWRSHGGDQSALGADCFAKSTAQIAEAAGTGTRTIEQAKKVLRDGSPEVKQAVKDGVIGLKKAAAIAAMPADQQAAAVSQPVKKALPATEASPAPATQAEDIEFREWLRNEEKAPALALAAGHSASEPEDVPFSEPAPKTAPEPAVAAAPGPIQADPGAVLAKMHAAFEAGLKGSLHATPVQPDPVTGRELVALSSVLVPGRDEITQEGCHRPAHWSHLMIGTMEPGRDRHIGATHGSAHWSQRRIGVMEPVPL